MCIISNAHKRCGQDKSGETGNEKHYTLYQAYNFLSKGTRNRRSGYIRLKSEKILGTTSCIN